MEYRLIQHTLPINDVPRAEAAIKELTDEGYHLVSQEITRDPTLLLLTFARHSAADHRRVHDAVNEATGHFVQRMREQGIDIEMVDIDNDKRKEPRHN